MTTIELPERLSVTGADSTTAIDSDDAATDTFPLASPGTIHPSGGSQAGVVDEDDDDLTIIGLDHDTEQGRITWQAATISWMERRGPETEERRRNLLLEELKRVQRASLIHFFLLCLIPTSLLFIMVAAVVGENEDCFSDATVCMQEARTFLNGFTTRCICDAINVSK